MPSEDVRKELKHAESEVLRIISLGWGVQSFALSCMSALGVLPPVDAAVHADTGWERAETYAFAEKWTPWLEARGVRVVTVHGGRPVMGMLPGSSSHISIPCFTARPDGEPSGMLRRQCTGDWKIGPIRRWCSIELKRARRSMGNCGYWTQTIAP